MKESSFLPFSSFYYSLQDLLRFRGQRDSWRRQNAGTQLAQLESMEGILSPTLILSFVALGLLPLIAKKSIQFVRGRRHESIIIGNIRGLIEQRPTADTPSMV